MKRTQKEAGTAREKGPYCTYAVLVVNVMNLIHSQSFFLVQLLLLFTDRQTETDRQTDRGTDRHTHTNTGNNQKTTTDSMRGLFLCIK